MQRASRTLADGRGGVVSAMVSLPEDRGAGNAPMLVLAHGAGAGMHHPFMTSMQERLTHRGLAVALFNFPYTERGRRAPDTAAVLEDCYRAVVEQLRADPDLRPQRLFLGGKSMGGRIATHLVAAGVVADGVVLLGYPLHPPGQREKPRRAHLSAITTALLFVQGTRDSLCNLDDLRRAVDVIRAPVRVHVVDGGDHSFKVPVRSGRSDAAVLDEVADACAAWVREAGEGA
jgi:hypothetical protein